MDEIDMVSAAFDPGALARAELRRRDDLREDLRLFAASELKIKDKGGRIVQFRFNRLQLYLHERIEEQKRRTGRVRLLIGKGRQGGASTYIGGRFYHQTSLRSGVQTYILTHEQEATDNLFAMVTRFHEHNPGRPHTGASNAKELFFDKLDSGYGVGTAGTKAVGRSKTIQRLHGSECAFWPNAAAHFAGIVQTVPDAEGTEIILESTGNGMSGEYFERWQNAEARIGDYEAVFCPWFWSEEYSRPVPGDFSLDEEEAEYRRLYNLTAGQMMWRRAKIAELKDPLLFRQEYAASASDMFQTTGHDAFINAMDVLRARKTVREGIGPLVIGVDPSRFGDDRFSIAWRKGRRLEKVESRLKLDVVSGANWCKQIIDNDRPARMFIDLGGVGAGTFDILQSWGGIYEKVTVGVNFGGEPQEAVIWNEDGSKTPGPRNRRAEMWSRSRDWLRQEGGVSIPDDDGLQADACGPSYTYDMAQRVLLESKEKMRARGIRSPDEWDAVVLTFAEPVRDDSLRERKMEPMLSMRGSGEESLGWMMA